MAGAATIVPRAGDDESRVASNAATACDHCGLPVPAGLIEPGAKLQFCCTGCETVYEIIHRGGLERYYALRDATARQRQAARNTHRAYAELDQPKYRELYCRPRGQGVTATELYLEGVHCAACVWLVEKLPRLAPGVIDARLNLRSGLVELAWDDRVTTLSTAARVLDSLGYAPHPARDLHARAARRREDRRFLIRLAVAGALAANVMLLAVALYAGMFSGIEAEYARVFRWVSMLLGLVSLAWPGRVFFTGAWAALRTRTAHLDLPIALGLTAGAATGVVNAVLGRGEIYFDSLAVLVFLLLVGRWVQHRQQRSANDAVELLFSLTPSTARVIDGNDARETPIEGVSPGDMVEVRAGETTPADGVVTSGTSDVDPSLLTGESQPQRVSVGDSLCAGAVNLTRTLRLRVDATGAETRIGQLMKLVEEGTRRKPAVVRLADRVAGWFVIVVVTLAALTLGLWLWLDPAHAVDHAVALLIVTCPCALGLATPLAMAVAIGRAARSGVLIKGADAFEQLARPATMLLDKTGTLTHARMSLLAWHGDESVKPWVAAVDAESTHPIGLALARELAPSSGTPAPSDTHESPGGVQGTVQGHHVVVGSPSFVTRAGVQMPDWIATALNELSADLTPVVIVVDGQARALAGLGDAVREEAAASLGCLRALGWKLAVLSGDAARTVKAVAARLGFAPSEAHGGVSPEDKVARVGEAQRDGTVVMVGDGVNDAAALARASVGIAVHGGAAASLAAADIYISKPGLSAILETIQAARRTMSTIRLAIGASLVYNAAACGLAVAGLVHPLLAAVLMPLSSLSVLAIALRKPAREAEPCR